MWSFLCLTVMYTIIIISLCPWKTEHWTGTLKKRDQMNERNDIEEAMSWKRNESSQMLYEGWGREWGIEIRDMDGRSQRVEGGLALKYPLSWLASDADGIKKSMEYWLNRTRYGIRRWMNDDDERVGELRKKMPLLLMMVMWNRMWGSHLEWFEENYCII